MEAKYIDELEKLNANNFWFRAKKKYLDFIIKKPGAIILDVGCGSGRNMTSYITRGFEVIGVDISEHALTLCKEKGYKVFQADLQKETIYDIHSAPDYITALDFIEHVQNPIEVLSNLRKISNQDTQMIVTVPSYQFLFSEWDQAMGHVKRYNRKMLCDELEKGGWEVSRSAYIHLVPLIPAVLLRKILKSLVPKVRPREENKREKFLSPHPILNWLLYYMYYPEFFWFRSRLPLPFGLSILAIATPKKERVST